MSVYAVYSDDPGKTEISDRYAKQNDQSLAIVPPGLIHPEMAKSPCHGAGCQCYDKITAAKAQYITIVSGALRYSVNTQRAGKEQVLGYHSRDKERYQVFGEKSAHAISPALSTVCSSITGSGAGSV